MWDFSRAYTATVYIYHRYTIISRPAQAKKAEALKTVISAR